VFDRTQLKGFFAIPLSYERVPPDPDTSGDVPPGPLLFDAIKTLGLELVPRKEEIEVLVIDHATRIPVNN